MVRIEDNKLMGEVVVVRQFLYNTGFDPGMYKVKIIFDGADINEVVTSAINDGIIAGRKIYRTPEACEALANGVSFHNLITKKAQETPDAKAATLDVNALSPEMFKMLMRKVQAKAEADAKADNEND